MNFMLFWRMGQRDRRSEVCNASDTIKSGIQQTKYTFFGVKTEVFRLIDHC